MDPDMQMVATLYHPVIHEEMLRRQFLLERADYLWCLGRYGDCISYLLEVNLNGLPLPFLAGFEIEIFMKWMRRASEVFECIPSLAEFLFDWCIPHAMTSFHQAQCLLYKGVATWLSGDQANGMKLIEDASLMDPELTEATVSVWKDSGIKALEDKDFPKSKNLFQRALILVPSETQQHKEMRSFLLSHLATAYFHLNEYQTALEKGEEAYELNPIPSHKEAEKWKERAEKLPKQGNFILLIKFYTMAIKLTPEEEDYANLRCTLLCNRSCAFADTNQYDKALDDAEKCARLNPIENRSKEMFIMFTVQGNKLLDHFPSLAIKFFDCSFPHTATSYDEARCLLYKGVALRLSGEHVKANNLIQQASENYPNIIEKTVHFWKKGGLKALEDKDFSKSRNHFQRALFLVPREACLQKETRHSLLSLLATACFHLNEYQTALEKGKEAYELNPVPSHDDAISWKERSETVLKEGNFLLLTEYCTLAMKLAPQDEENCGDLRFTLLSSRCLAYSKTNQFEKALEDAKESFAINPNWSKGHEQLGDILDGLGRHREAVLSYWKAFDIADISEQKSSIVLGILSVSEKIPDGTTDVILDVPRDIINDTIKRCVDDQEWGKLRLLFLGGGGPHKYGYGQGGLATVCDASDVPLELVVEWGINNSVEFLPEFLDKLVKNGASILGSPACSETPLEIAEKTENQDIIQVISKYQKGLDVHLALSKSYYEKQDYRKCIDICNKAFRYCSKEVGGPSPSFKQIHFEILCLRSSSHYELKKFEEALEDGLKATKIKPDDIKGHTLLVSCYKVLERRSEMLSSLNECLRTEWDAKEQWKLLKEAITVAEKLPKEGTTALTTNISTELLNRLQKEAISSKDWNLIRLLYLGGGGPEKFRKGEGGIATGRVSASRIPIEDVIATKFMGKQETLSVLLDQGASVKGLKGNTNLLVSALEKEQLEVAKILLEHGANPRVRTKTNGGQPLVHEVVKKAIDTGKLNNKFTGYLELLQCFIKNHHSTVEHAKDSKGNTLYHLVMSGKITDNKCKIIELLLNANVDPTISNKQGKRPTDLLKKGDDRKKMISKFLKERKDKYANSNPSQDKQVEKSVNPDASPKQDLSPASQNNMATSSKSTAKKMKKKPENIRKELERLIESVTAFKGTGSGMHLDYVKAAEATEKEANKFQELAQKTDEKAFLDDATEKSEEKSEAIIKEIDQTTFENLEWEVDFSDKFKKRFRGKKIQQRMKMRIVEKIIMLAQGRFSCKRLEGEPKTKGIHLYESKLTEGARILWERTIAFSPNHSRDQSSRIYTDIIRVWDVVMDHGNLDHEIKNVVRSIVKSNERGLGCRMKVMVEEIKKENPESATATCYPSFYEGCTSKHSNDEQNSENKNVCFPPASPERNEYNILKFYSFTYPIFEAILNNEGKAEINFPFKVTELEHEIINLKLNHPLILLGRSGTGKTTCCLYRLYVEFQTYWENAAKYGPSFPKYIPSKKKSRMKGAAENCGAPSSSSSSSSSSSILDREANAMGCNSEEFEHFHPIFITKNDVLCTEVQKSFQELINTNQAMKSVIMCKASLPNRIQDIGETSWPLIVSSRDWLLLLDASLPGESFFQRKQDGRLQNIIKGWGKGSTHLRCLSIEYDDEEHNIGKSQKDDKAEDNDKQNPKTKTCKDRKPTELTYQVFRDEFWPKMRTEIKKKIHPTLVWTEIKSFIKGSAEALNTRQGFLSIDEYQKIGRKRAPNFTGDRETIYGLFEFYQRFLASKRMFDEADLVYHLHKRLSDNPELPWAIHSVYVDETQDFTQAELSLLIRCCQYRNRMFFTGDTAQSIMRGIAFRFEDIKTLLYSFKSFDDSIIVPHSLYQLTHNYRSHSGILKLASSIVKLLSKFFPQSFDKLEEDTALFDGPKPVLLESCTSSDLPSLLRGNKRQTSRIEFGAHQAVLVVSEEARNNMPEELKHGLVLTIYEAKGLEFDDVLIYNFFKDSQATNEWRVVTSCIMEEQHEDTAQSGTTGLVKIHERKQESFKSKPLEFQYDQHKVLNSEFKLLYTAVTRARVNLWFFDEDEKNRRPMFEYFQRLRLVEMNVLEGQEESSATLPAPTFAESSTKKEWRDKGIHYYNQRKWDLAEKCFAFADDERMASQSKAQKMVQEASAQHDNEKFCAAAVEFLKYDMANEAADCLKNADEKRLLEKLYKRMGKTL